MSHQNELPNLLKENEPMPAGESGVVRRNCIWAQTFLLVTIGCSSGAGAGGDGPSEMSMAMPPTVRDSAGITIVENAEPQWTQGSAWRVGTTLTSVGEAEGGLDYELYQVVDATRLSDGSVVVGNSSTGELRFFDRDGRFVRSVGSNGGGPGEFRGANALRALRRVAGDTLITWDIYAQSISVFAPNGDYVRSFRFDGPSRQHFFTGIFADRSILMHVYESTRSAPGASLPEGLVRRDRTLFHYGPDHSLVNSIEDVIDSDMFQARWARQGIVMGEAPFGRITTVNVGSSRVYVATGDSDEITVYDQTGQIEMLIRRLLDPNPVTAGMISRDRERRLREEEAELDEMRVQPRVRRMIAELPYPEFVPPYGTTVLDSDQNLWVEEFRVNADEPHVWSVFDSEGIWQGRLTLPAGIRIYEIGADYILGKSVDDMEVERVVVYELIKSENLESN